MELAVTAYLSPEKSEAVEVAEANQLTVELDEFTLSVALKAGPQATAPLPVMVELITPIETVRVELQFIELVATTVYTVEIEGVTMIELFVDEVFQTSEPEDCAVKVAEFPKHSVVDEAFTVKLRLLTVTETVAGADKQLFNEAFTV